MGQKSTEEKIAALEEPMRSYVGGLADILEVLGIEPTDVPFPPGGYGGGGVGDPVTVILRNPKTKRIEVRHPDWGLIPSWADLKGQVRRNTHAKAETLSTLASFKEAFASRRCIFPMAHYHQVNQESRYAISRCDKATMGVAGLWEFRKMEEGRPLVTAAIVTVPANELIAEIHDRMPAILEPADYLAWLDPEATDPKDLQPLLRPFDPHALRYDYVGSKSARANARMRKKIGH